MSWSKNLRAQGKDNSSNIFIPQTFLCTATSGTKQEKLLEIHASQNPIYWMLLALQETGTIGESKAAEKSPCRGQRIGAERQAPEIAQKLILFLWKEKCEGFAGGRKKGDGERNPRQEHLVILKNH